MNQERLLIADDDEISAGVAKASAESAGIDTHVACDGGDVIEEVARWRPSIILLDVVLPVLNGFEVLEELKRRSIATRVVMWSGKTTGIEDAVRAIRAGACDYIVKPVDPKVLVGRLKRCLLLDSALNLKVSEQAPFMQALLEREEAPLVRDALEHIRQRRQRERFSRRVFIVHGRDDRLKCELARFLEHLELIPVILREQPDRGQTILHKLQFEMQDVGFAFILLSPDDVGGLAGKGEEQRRRARQNVLFEHGLFVGVLGASRVCAIELGEIERPSDLHGVLYKTLPEGSPIETIGGEIAKELIAAGYSIDASRLASSAGRRSLRRSTRETESAPEVRPSEKNRR